MLASVPSGFATAMRTLARRVRRLSFIATVSCCIVNYAIATAADAQQGVSASRGDQDHVLLDRTAAPAVTLPGTEQFDVASASGLRYRIFVGVPAGEPPEHGWPVLYHTDANDHFPIVVAAAQKQNRGELNALVVGIGYPDEDRRQRRLRRSLDLTLPTPLEWIESNARELRAVECGGCAPFLAFIVDELKPAVEQAYSVDRRRQTLLGHSFGGVFVLYALFERPESFQSYVAISPSIWWANGAVLDAERAFSSKASGTGLAAKPRLFVGVGGLEEQPAAHDTPEHAELRVKRRMVGSAREMCERLRGALGDLGVYYAEFEGANHGTVVLPAIARGVAFALQPQQGELEACRS